MSINEEQFVVICTSLPSAEVGDNEALTCELVPLWATPLRAGGVESKSRTKGLIARSAAGAAKSEVMPTRKRCVTQQRIGELFADYASHFYEPSVGSGWVNRGEKCAGRNAHDGAWEVGIFFVRRTRRVRL